MVPRASWRINLLRISSSQSFESFNKSISQCAFKYWLKAKGDRERRSLYRKRESQ